VTAMTWGPAGAEGTVASAARCHNGWLTRNLAGPDTHTHRRAPSRCEQRSRTPHRWSRRPLKGESRSISAGAAASAVGCSQPRPHATPLPHFRAAPNGHRYARYRERRAGSKPRDRTLRRSRYRDEHLRRRQSAGYPAARLTGLATHFRGAAEPRRDPLRVRHARSSPARRYFGGSRSGFKPPEIDQARPIERVAIGTRRAKCELRLSDRSGDIAC